MKHCPACNFSFPDFHHVCDFDGTELVADLEEAKESPRPSFIRRCTNSPVFLMGLTTTALLSSAILIGYLDSANDSSRVVKHQPSPAPLAGMVSVARASGQSRALSKKPIPATHRTVKYSHKPAKPSLASLHRHPTASRSGAHLNQSKSVGNSSRRADVVRRAEPAQTPVGSAPRTSETVRSTEPAQTSVGYSARRSEPVTWPEPQKTSHQKEIGFTAMMKTTWHVLKRPFKF